MNHILPQRITISLSILLILGILTLLGVNSHVTSTFSLRVKEKHVKDLLIVTAELEAQYMELTSSRFESLQGGHNFEVIDTPRLIKRTRVLGFVTESGRR